jgi:transposase
MGRKRQSAKRYQAAAIYISPYLRCSLPLNRKNRALISPELRMEMMQKHLQLIADATPKGRYTIVIMDRASWHSNKTAVKFDNLAIMHFPPYSPELNPIEQVWAWLRDNDLANFAFKDYEHIVEQVSQGWNNFRHQVEQVKTLCLREWANLIT